MTHSKLTAQNQISVPAAIRRKLGVGPGSVLEWSESEEGIIVRRVGRFSSQQIHEKIFGNNRPSRHSLSQLKDGIRNYVRKRYARD